MSFRTRIAFLDNLVGGTLSMMHFSEWELGSYGKNTLFLHDGPIGPVCALDFEECIDKAFQAVREAIHNV